MQSEPVLLPSPQVVPLRVAPKRAGWNQCLVARSLFGLGDGFGYLDVQPLLGDDWTL